MMGNLMELFDLLQMI